MILLIIDVVELNIEIYSMNVILFENFQLNAKFKNNIIACHIKIIKFFRNWMILSMIDIIKIKFWKLHTEFYSIWER